MFDEATILNDECSSGISKEVEEVIDVEVIGEDEETSKGVGRFGDTFACSVEVFDEETFMAIWGGDFDSRGLDIVEVDDDIIGEVMKERQWESVATVIVFFTLFR